MEDQNFEFERLMKLSDEELKKLTGQPVPNYESGKEDLVLFCLDSIYGISR